MIDRPELYARWHSVSLLIGTRAAGASQKLQPDTITGSHERIQAPNNSDWIERKELQGGMQRWLEDSACVGEVMEAMHAAIVEATEQRLQTLLACIERSEWMLKVKWENARHRRLKASEADQHGKQESERTLIAAYRGRHTKDVAEELQMSEGAIRWIRRKHGLSIKGERIYPCTVAPLNSCPVCQSVNQYHDEYMDQEAA